MLVVSRLHLLLDEFHHMKDLSIIYLVVKGVINMFAYNLIKMSWLKDFSPLLIT